MPLIETKILTSPVLLFLLLLLLVVAFEENENGKGGGRGFLVNGAPVASTPSPSPYKNFGVEVVVEDSEQQQQEEEAGAALREEEPRAATVTSSRVKRSSSSPTTTVPSSASAVVQCPHCPFRGVRQSDGSLAMWETGPARDARGRDLGVRRQKVVHWRVPVKEMGPDGVVLQMKCAYERILD